MKTLKFEGAGWDKAESNGVGNCRIRATFINDAGKTIYLELTGHARHQYSSPSLRNFTFPWHISHLHVVDTTTGKRDENKRHQACLRDTWKITREYTKENLLWLVNKKLGCSFDAIEVINDGTWSGFSVDGKDSSEAV